MGIAKMDEYLASSQYIDWQHPDVLAKARVLSEGLDTPIDIARACFAFVKDEIKHSWDYQLNPVTCRASDVLAHRTGYCYAKSHLLAALLRANGIPAGLCYQRLTSMTPSQYCLHGLNAVYLQEFGWYRVDARGDKPGVNAAFCPPQEQLAYAATAEGEADLPEIWPAPLPVVVDRLTGYETYQAVAENLPDVPLLGLR